MEPMVMQIMWAQGPMGTGWRIISSPNLNKTGAFNMTAFLMMLMAKKSNQGFEKSLEDLNSLAIDFSLHFKEGDGDVAEGFAD